MNPILPDDAFYNYNMSEWEKGKDSRIVDAFRGVQRYSPVRFVSTSTAEHLLSAWFGWDDEMPPLPPRTAMWPIDSE